MKNKYIELMSIGSSTDVEVEFLIDESSLDIQTVCLPCSEDDISDDLSETCLEELKEEAICRLKRASPTREEINDTWKIHIIYREGKPDLKFTGILLAEAKQIKLYKTRGGQFVFSVFTALFSETAWVMDRPEEIIEIFGNGRETKALLKQAGFLTYEEIE